MTDRRCGFCVATASAARFRYFTALPKPGAGKPQSDRSTRNSITSFATHHSIRSMPMCLVAVDPIIWPLSRFSVEMIPPAGQAFDSFEMNGSAQGLLRFDDAFEHRAFARGQCAGRDIADARLVPWTTGKRVFQPLVLEATAMTR